MRVPDDGRTRLALREATMDDHRRVDDLFAGFSLSSSDDYAAFLKAHAMALGALEPAAKVTSPRFPLLASDLAELKENAPPSLPQPAVASEAFRWGLLYALEGSRLGGAMLARQVRADLPSAYLSAAHGKGEWKALQIDMDKAAAQGGAEWVDDAIAGARAAFTIFGQAAQAQRQSAHG